MSLYFRILKYLKPYWTRLRGSIVCVILFVIFSSITVLSGMPFLSTLFAVEGKVPGEAVPVSPGTDGRSSLPARINIDAVKDKLYLLFLGKDWQQNRMQALSRFSLIMVFVVLLRSVFGYYQAYLMAYVEQGVIKDLRDEIYRHIHALSLSYFNKTRTGQLISRITNDVTLLNGGLSAGFYTLMKNPLRVLVSLIFAFLISWELTLIAFLILPFSLFAISWIGLHLRKSSTVSQESMADVTSVLQETISGIRIVKAFRMDEFEIKKFGEQTVRYFKILLKLTRGRNLASPMSEFLGTVVAIGILYFGGRQVLIGAVLTPDEFITFLFIIFSLM